VRRLLPARCEPLHNDSLRAAGWVVVGARGWTAPDDPIATAADERVFHRELERLRLSIAHADRTHGGGPPRLAMVHYPPLLAGRPPGEVVETLQRAGVRHCVYGHLHGDDHRLAVHGEHGGIRYHFVAADAIDFAPLEIDLEQACAGGER
jgi:predicted phosphohydrolase